jgi:hypothetical protein
MNINQYNRKFKVKYLKIKCSNEVVKLFDNVVDNMTYQDWLDMDKVIVDFLQSMNYKYPKNWKCPIDHEGCVRNCGNYGCGN